MKNIYFIIYFLNMNILFQRAPFFFFRNLQEELDGYEVHDNTNFASPNDSVDQELDPGLMLNTALKHTCRIKKSFKP